MFALKRRAIGVSVALVAAASLTASLLLSTALAQDPPDPSIASITVSDTTMDAATVTVNLADDDADGTTVYLKYGPTRKYNTNPKPPAYNVYGDDSQDPFLHVDEKAPPLQATSLNGAATFALPASALPPAKRLNRIQDLWSSYDVNLEASLDSEFTGDVVTEIFTTLPPTAVGAWVDAEKTAMGIQTWLSHLSGIPHTVYYRWRAQDATTWNTGSFVVPWGNPQTDTHQVMTGLVALTPYVMEVSLDPNFPADETMTETAWTREPDVVRMGIRKVTESEATVTAIMDYPNGNDFSLLCQFQPADTPGDQKNWRYQRNRPGIDGYVGSTLLQSLTDDTDDVATDYEYGCKLLFNVWGYESGSRLLRGKYLRTLGTDPALTEISGTLSGTTATVTVDLVNTDGSARNIYLRHRQYPNEQWNSTVTQSTAATSTEFTLTGLADDAVHEIQAGVEVYFLDKTTLTLFLAVGNPPYDTVANSDGTPPEEIITPLEETTTPLEETITPTEDTTTPLEEIITPTEETNNPPVDDNQNNENQNNNNGGGTLPQSNSGRSGGGGGFGGGAQTRNTAPKFRDSARDTRSVPENSEEGVLVGKPILAWDPENDDLTFTLRGDDAEPFTIDEETGQILVGPEAVLDYEAQDVHVVTLVVTDPGGEETTTELEIHLTDVKLPGKADIFDVANNHNEMLEREEVEAAGAAYGLGLISKLEVLFIVKYYYDTMLPDVDFENLPSMTDKYDLNEDSIIDRDEVLAAMQDFLEGSLSRSALQEIVKVYYTNIEEQAQEAEPAQT